MSSWSRSPDGVTDGRSLTTWSKPSTRSPSSIAVTLATSELAVREARAAERRDLLLRERRLGEVLAEVERAEEVHDVVHPLVEVRPVACTAIVGRRGHRLEFGEECGEVAVDGVAEALRVLVGEVPSEREHPARQRQHHQRLGD